MNKFDPDNIPNKDKLDECTSCYLSSLSKMGIGTMILINNHGWVTGLTNIGNPNEWLLPISSYLTAVNKSVIDGSLDKNSMDSVVQFSLVTSVMKHFDNMKFIDDYRKYKDFKEGKIENLSEEDQDRFLDMALAEKRIKNKKNSIKFEIDLRDDVLHLKLLDTPFDQFSRSFIISLCNVFIDVSSFNLDCTSKTLTVLFNPGTSQNIEVYIDSIKSFIKNNLNFDVDLINKNY